MSETFNELDSFQADSVTRLYSRTWRASPETTLKSRLVFVHGYSDHCNAYYDLFPTLNRHGIEVWGFDQRGWGRSVSTVVGRGDSGPTGIVLEDIRNFINHVDSQPLSPQSSNAVPLFLMGHSMGGAQVLLLSLLDSQPTKLPYISGILLESPFIAFHPSAQPNPITLMAGKLAAKVLPKRGLLQKLESKHLCRDPQVCVDFEKDELCHDTGTLEGLSSMLQRSADLSALAKGQKVRGLSLRTFDSLNNEGTPTVPIWIGHGTEDRVTSCAMSEKLFGRLDVKDKTLKLYPEAYHKLHAEPHGVAQEFANDIAKWILQRSNMPAQDGYDEDVSRPKL